jgi:hypothetical protein
MLSAPETLTLRATAIAGERYTDDYAVIWRGMSVGRILLGSGAPHDRPQWTWFCHVHGRPQGGDDRGNAATSLMLRRGSRTHGRGFAPA